MPLELRHVAEPLTDTAAAASRRQRQIETQNLLIVSDGYHYTLHSGCCVEQQFVVSVFINSLIHNSHSAVEAVHYAL